MLLVTTENIFDSLALFKKLKEKLICSNALTMDAQGANVLNSLEAEM